MSDATAAASAAWRRWRPVAVGVGLAAATALVSEWLPLDLASDLHALVLVFVAAPYVGFAAGDGRPRRLATEFAGVAAFCVLAVVGLWAWPPAWILGFAGHAVWDALHHPAGGFGATIAGWYVPFCAVYDLLVAAYLSVTLFG